MVAEEEEEVVVVTSMSGGVGGVSPWAGPGEERPPLGRSAKDKRRVRVSLESEGKRLHHSKTSYCNLG